MSKIQFYGQVKAGVIPIFRVKRGNRPNLTYWKIHFRYYFSDLFNFIFKVEMLILRSNERKYDTNKVK